MEDHSFQKQSPMQCKNRFVRWWNQTGLVRWWNQTCFARWWKGESEHPYGSSDAYDTAVALFGIIAAASISMPFLEEGSLEPDEKFGRISSIIFYLAMSLIAFVSFHSVASPHLDSDSNVWKHCVTKGSIRMMRRMSLVAGFVVAVVFSLAVLGELPNQRQEYYERQLRVHRAEHYTFKQEPLKGQIGVKVTVPFSSSVEFPNGIPDIPLLIGRLNDEIASDCSIENCLVKRLSPEPKEDGTPDYKPVPDVSLPAITANGSQNRELHVEAAGVAKTGTYKSEWLLSRRDDAQKSVAEIVEYINSRTDGGLTVTLVSREYAKK